MTRESWSNPSRTLQRQASSTTSKNEYRIADLTRSEDHTDQEEVVTFGAGYDVVGDGAALRVLGPVVGHRHQPVDMEMEDAQENSQESKRLLVKQIKDFLKTGLCKIKPLNLGNT